MSDGDCELYLNGEWDTGGDSGTPAAGTENILVGDRGAGTTNFDGDIPEVIVLSGLLTAEEISQYYTATKHLYGK